MPVVHLEVPFVFTLVLISLLFLFIYCIFLIPSPFPPHKHIDFPSFGMDTSIACKRENTFS